MDISKLPKLSNTKSQTPPSDNPEPVPPPEPAIYPYKPQPANIGGDIWISLIIGIILAIMGGRFARYAIATLTHQPFHTDVNWTEGPKSGTEVDYFDLEGFTAWSEMGIFFFGLTLLFEAAAKTFVTLKPGVAARAVLMLAILLTLLAVVLNVIASMKMLSVGITPLISCLAVAYGGWILFDESATLKRMASAHRQ